MISLQSMTWIARESDQAHRAFPRRRWSSETKLWKNCLRVYIPNHFFVINPPLVVLVVWNHFEHQLERIELLENPSKCLICHRVSPVESAYSIALTVMYHTNTLMWAAFHALPSSGNCLERLSKPVFRSVRMIFRTAILAAVQRTNTGQPYGLMGNEKQFRIKKGTSDDLVWDKNLFPSKDLVHLQRKTP